MCDNKSTDIKIGLDFIHYFFLGPQLLKPCVYWLHQPPLANIQIAGENFQGWYDLQGARDCLLDKKMNKVKKKISAAYSPEIQLFNVAPNVFVCQMEASSQVS